MTEQDVYKLAILTARKVAPKYGLDVLRLARLAVAVSHKETGGRYDPAAKNGTSSARGLMQVLICTQRWMEEKLSIPFAPASIGIPSSCKQYVSKVPKNVAASQDKMYDAAYNMLIGMTYLAYQLKRYKNNERQAAHAFNQGSYNSSSAGASYAQSVMDRYSNINFAAYDKAMPDVYAVVTTTPRYEFM